MRSVAHFLRVEGASVPSYHNIPPSHTTHLVVNNYAKEAYGLLRVVEAP
jgi:hypothetical protein